MSIIDTSLGNLKQNNSYWIIRYKPIVYHLFLSATLILFFTIHSTTSFSKSYLYYNLFYSIYEILISYLDELVNMCELVGLINENYIVHK